MPAITKGFSQVVKQQEPQIEDADVLPPVEQWDYQSAEVGPRGEDLPAGAQAWQPDGKPFFGDGVTGKLKSYWWNFTKDIPNTASVDEMTRLWNESKKNVASFGQGGGYTSLSGAQKADESGQQFRQNILDAFSGRGAPLTEEDQKELKQLKEKVAQQQQGVSLTPEEQARFEQLTKGNIDESLLSGPKRLVGVGVTAGLDLFNSAAYGTKQALGAARGIAEGVQETGAGFDIANPETRSQERAARESYWEEAVRSGEINPYAAPPSQNWQDVKESLKTALMYSPLGVAYNAIRTALSPNEGKWDVVKTRMNEGWDSGRILYTQAFDPAVRYEYERRLREGENPELLAMELANPWAEMVGEMVLDPTNLIGAVFKGAKVSGKIDEAMDAGQALVKTLDSTLDENIELFAKVSTDEGAARVVREAAESYVKKTAERAELRAQKYGWTQLTSTSQKNRLMRDTSNFFGTTISGMIKDGRGPDDIAAILKYGIMSVADDVDEAAEGIMGLMNASVPKQFFSELGNDSLSTVRRMLTNSDGALDINKITKALSGENPIESMLKIADDAAAQRFASVQEMEKAAKAVESGKNVTDAQRKLAQAYENVPQHVKLFTKVIQPAEKAKGVVNSGLGFFYFTVNPGTAVRNTLSNKIFIMMDEGVGAFFDGGVFRGVKDIEGHLTKHLGYEYKVGETFGSQAGAAEKLSLMQKGEKADALRIIDTRYTEAFSKITETALPFDDTLRAAGMSEGQFKMFKELVKKEGNMQDAMTAFNQMQGLADWRTLDFLDPTQVNGLKQAGNVWDELLDISKNPDATLDDINAFVDAKIKAYNDVAAEAANDVPGFGHNWKSSQDARQLYQAVDEKLISNADFTKMGQVQEASEQAIELYKTKLIENIEALKLTDPDKALELSLKNQRFMNEAEAGGKAVRQEIDGMWNAVWDVKRGKRDGAQIWKELGFQGAPPDTEMAFFDELFAQARTTRANKWEEYFSSAIGRSEELIGELEKAGADINDLTNSFERARALDAKAQEFKSAFYLNNGKAYVGAPPKGTKLGQMDYESTNAFLQEMGWNRGGADALKNAVNKDTGKAYKTWQEVPWNEALDVVKGRTASVAEEVAGNADYARRLGMRDDEFVKEVNKFLGVPDAEKIPLDKVKDIPRGQLPELVSRRMEQEARRLASELSGGQAGSRGAAANQLGEGATEAFGTTNVNWYREIYKEKKLGKPQIDKALDKIVQDAGKDKGVNVERMKDFITDNFAYGDKASGTPPDLAVLKALGADDATMNKALDAFNEITRQNVSMDEALRASGYTEQGFASIDEIPEGIAQSFADARPVANSDSLLKRVETKQVVPVHPAGAEPSVARQYLETQKGFTETMEYVRSQVTQNWGKMTGGGDVSQALASYGAKYSNRLIDAKSMSLKVAEYWRDFTLLGYSTDKTFGNLAHAYIQPYSFWYSGTYRNMMDRIVTDPQVIAGYSKYRKAVEQEHRFAPDWYKQQVQVNNLFGIELENPLFFNLEATLNPLNGLTGADFNDRTKRVNWWTSTLDDMGKFGPSNWAPLQIATAISLSMQGDQDAALRWAGRLIPQSPAIKAVTSLLGKPTELDPNVLLFGGGDSPFDIFGAMDSYERGRVARALGDVRQQEADAILNDPSMSSAEKKAAIAELEAKYTDIAYNQEGPEWQEAYRLATNLRAPGQITSPLLGVGFKARTQTDIEIDEMYTQMNMLMTMRDGMGKEDYQKAWEQLREQFPYMDTVLLARKGGELRDGAYAYNVLARIPPGKTDDIFRELKINDLADKFYNNNGSMEGWNKQDKDRFMAAILDVGATLAIPPDATRQEWTAAKNANNAMYDLLEEKYGNDIFQMVTEYYGVKENNYQAGRLYLEAHPEVQDYLNDKSNAVATNPLLYKYYGSLQTIESYYESNLRAELSDKYGDDIYDLASQYSSLPKEGSARKEWRNENKEEYKRLKGYWDDLYNEGTERNVNEAILRLYQNMPEADETYLRGEAETVAQQALVDAIAGPPGPEQVVSQIPQDIQELIGDYWRGEDMPEAALEQLGYIGQRYGLSADDLLIMVGAQ